ncbi:hypothetical protein SDC9_152309 [bioreactor metagenome]|uniref:Uncharacterized protein n=1 Tax=bioreactor metagenome TaxID=1076179 RepID=A0A645EV32_9ZZZZ
MFGIIKHFGLLEQYGNPIFLIGQSRNHLIFAGLGALDRRQTHFLISFNPGIHLGFGCRIDVDGFPAKGNCVFEIVDIGLFVRLERGFLGQIIIGLGDLLLGLLQFILEVIAVLLQTVKNISRLGIIQSRILIRPLDEELVRLVDKRVGRSFLLLPVHAVGIDRTVDVAPDAGVGSGRCHAGPAGHRQHQAFGNSQIHNSLMLLF